MADWTMKRIVRKIFAEGLFAGGFSAVRVLSDWSQGLARNPLVTNLNAANANTEVSHTFQDNTQRFTIRLRDKTAVGRVAWVQNGTGTNWITLETGVTYSENNVDLDSRTIYLRADKSNQIFEILEWAQ